MKGQCPSARGSAPGSRQDNAGKPPAVGEVEAEQTILGRTVATSRTESSIFDHEIRIEIQWAELRWV